MHLENYTPGWIDRGRSRWTEGLWMLGAVSAVWENVPPQSFAQGNRATAFKSFD
jgi:hypothetical protein